MFFESLARRFSFRTSDAHGLHRNQGIEEAAKGYSELMHLHDGAKLVIIMVGLPGRGKSFTSRKLAAYLNWLGYNTKIFNIGQYRRKKIGADARSDFFDPNNEEGQKARQQMATYAMEDLLEYLKTEGEVAVFDGTNSTKQRREWVMDYINQNWNGSRVGSESNETEDTALIGVHTMFVELVCNDSDIIEGNIRETKLTSPDYVGMDPEQAVVDFRKRIANYEKVYQPIDSESEDHLSYIKLIGAGRQVIMNNVRGFLMSKLVSFLMNVHIVSRPIFLCRSGETTYNVQNRIGGDPPLSPRGEAFAAKLGEAMVAEISMMEEDARAKAKFASENGTHTKIQRNLLEEENGSIRLNAWVSSRQSAVQTIQHVKCERRIQWKSLDDLQTGICDGMTYNDIEKKMPDLYKQRTEDKFNYRYPRGESYADVVKRLEPVIFELERQRMPVDSIV